MKNIFLRLMAVALFSSCTNTKAMQDTSWQQYGRTEQATDPFLQSLQQSNELVLVFAVESYAWIKSVNYKALAMNNGEWTGYNWYVNKSPGAEAVKPNVNPSSVSNDSGNAVWKFFTDKEVWKVKGDNGESFCTGEKANSCNINDGVQWRLMIITKDKIIDPVYYEPEFFENCCPGNADRALFIEAIHRMTGIMGISR